MGVIRSEHMFRGGLFALLLVMIAATAGSIAGAKRRFTVKDSIELSYIVDSSAPSIIGDRVELPTGTPIYSPDRRFFLIVTQSGRLAANRTEGTIWLFTRKAVLDYLLGKSPSSPNPKKLITMSATSNTRVISDVRWVDDTQTIAFMGKNGSPYQQLFQFDIAGENLQTLTKDGVYVTAYDIRGGTIAYTTLEYEEHPLPFDENLVAAGDKSILQLLYSQSPPPEGIGDDFLLRRPSLLHVQKDGKDLPLEFRTDQGSLHLFVPALFISPNSSWLITAAPIPVIPAAWEQYSTPFPDRRLHAGPVHNLKDKSSFWRPEQFVKVNLASGVVSSLVDAPLGRDLGYADTPAEAFWFHDNRHAVLTNTYLPLTPSFDATTRVRREGHSMIALVDVPTGEVGPSLEINRDALDAAQHSDVNGIRWDIATKALTLCYDGEVQRDPELFILQSDRWVQAGAPAAGCSAQNEMQLTVRQDLNTPPKLWGRADKSGKELMVWDPNQGLLQFDLGQAALYQWKDSKGEPRSGILVLPPNYLPDRRYPLVIQTHGYQRDRFFADGWATTGSGGRALAARDVVILQMDESFAQFSTSAEAPLELDAMESAVTKLSAAGVIDANRVGVIGFSRTCFHVRYALIHRPHLFRAASITDGFDPSYVAYTIFSGNYDSVIPQIEKINGGPPYGNNLSSWIHNAAGFNLDKVETPLLISAFEPWELLEQWETFSALRRLNKPVDFLWWWKGDVSHILVQPAQRYASQQSAVDWFDFWLNDREDTDPQKQEQYVRWRRLRQGHTNQSTVE